MSLSIQHMEADGNSYTFIPIEVQKHPLPRDIPIRFIAYKTNVNLCPVTTLKEYLKRREKTSTINITKKIFVTHHKPIRDAHKEIISRWVK